MFIIIARNACIATVNNDSLQHHKLLSIYRRNELSKNRTLPHTSNYVTLVILFLLDILCSFQTRPFLSTYKSDIVCFILISTVPMKRARKTTTHTAVKAAASYSSFYGNTRRPYHYSSFCR